MFEQETITRTGNIFSIAASEFKITIDGHEYIIWSGPWNDDEPDEEERKALDMGRTIHFWFLRGWEFTEREGDKTTYFYNGDDRMDQDEAMIGALGHGLQ